MVPGRYMTKHCDNLNRKRLFNSKYKSSDKALKRRKLLLGRKKSRMDKHEEVEGTLYEAGAF